MKTIAIDFETANETRASACSVGLAFIEDGKITRVEERLIRPPDMRFASRNIEIHGIRPRDVEDAPEFPEVLDEFIDDFRDATMIAHNAAFDFSVLRASCDQYKMSYPTLSYLCTVKMAQKVWPDLPSHKLNVIADYLKLKFVHHNAVEDAVVCAAASLRMVDDLGLADVREIPQHIGILAGSLYPGGYSACTVRKGTSFKRA